MRALDVENFAISLVRLRVGAATQKVYSSEIRSPKWPSRPDPKIWRCHRRDRSLFGASNMAALKRFTNFYTRQFERYAACRFQQCPCPCFAQTAAEDVDRRELHPEWHWRCCCSSIAPGCQSGLASSKACLTDACHADGRYRSISYGLGFCSNSTLPGLWSMLLVPCQTLLMCWQAVMAPLMGK
jgi:hypothetical protein